MFKKLISNLPFNPSLIKQVSFYAQRVHKEKAVRRWGLIFVVIAMLVQVFAVISPPEPTLAESDNDMVRGGFTSLEQAVNICRTNTQGFGEVLSNYKVDCDKLQSAQTVTLNSNDFGGQLDSMGRIAQGPTIARTGKVTDEYPVMINGTEYHMRNLWAWDNGTTNTNYKALKIVNPDGVTIFVLFNCGNLVTIGKYVPPPPPPTDLCPNIAGVQTNPNQCDVCPNISGEQHNVSECDKCPAVDGVQSTVAECDVCPNIEGVQSKKTECDVCPNVPGEQSNKSECYPCPKAQKDNSQTVCLELNKTASNQTQNLTNADGTVAQAGDTIIYTLSAKNTGTKAVKDFVFDENLSDVLNYADVVDLDGGQLQENKTVLWSKMDIAAGATVQKKITVRVKNPIPQTPNSTSDPTAFDMIMNNVFYGTAVNIELPPSVSKSTEVLAASLPNTGPGETLAVGFVVTVIVGYFFARSRLMSKELNIVRSDFAATGGM